jgi:hypothetical protein
LFHNCYYSPGKPPDAFVDRERSSEGKSWSWPRSQHATQLDLPLADSEKSIIDWCKEGNIAEVLRLLKAASPIDLDQLDDNVRLTALILL